MSTYMLAFPVLTLSGVVLMLCFTVFRFVRMLRQQRRLTQAALDSVGQWRKIAADWETSTNLYKETSERNARTAESALETAKKWREMYEGRGATGDGNVVAFPVKH